MLKSKKESKKRIKFSKASSDLRIKGMQAFSALQCMKPPTSTSSKRNKIRARASNAWIKNKEKNLVRMFQTLNYRKIKKRNENAQIFVKKCRRRARRKYEIFLQKMELLYREKCDNEQEENRERRESEMILIPENPKCEIIYVGIGFKRRPVGGEKLRSCHPMVKLFLAV